ncbi:hypothetical protein [Nocardioides sp. SYSU D00038]|uniref:hypothetical protein n=1 Tax=Nocardioides sp. SYSU D00038 TaxID=2812554 RepID=UPI0019672567|nr:hypothetical protein [Nocardioides sp. SYSU D00038]
MLRPRDLTQLVVVDPPLEPRTRALVAGLAAVPGATRVVWPGQPGPRSPWAPCPDGCCLVLCDDDPGAARWLRFLVRELVAPRAAGPLRRSRRMGLPGGHRLDGRALVEHGGSGPVLVVVTHNRVREVPLDDDLFPLRRPRRGPGEVVPLGRRGREES